MFILYMFNSILGTINDFCALEYSDLENYESSQEEMVGNIEQLFTVEASKIQEYENTMSIECNSRANKRLKTDENFEKDDGSFSIINEIHVKDDILAKDNTNRKRNLGSVDTKYMKPKITKKVEIPINIIVCNPNPSTETNPTNICHVISIKTPELKDRQSYEFYMKLLDLCNNTTPVLFCMGSLNDIMTEFSAHNFVFNYFREQLKTEQKSILGGLVFSNIRNQFTDKGICRGGCDMENIKISKNEVKSHNRYRQGKENNEINNYQDYNRINQKRFILENLLKKIFKFFEAKNDKIILIEPIEKEFQKLKKIYIDKLFPSYTFKECSCLFHHTKQLKEINTFLREMLVSVGIINKLWHGKYNNSCCVEKVLEVNLYNMRMYMKRYIELNFLSINYWYDCLEEGLQQINSFEI